MKTTVHDRRLEPRERDIQKAAYFLWLEQGRPEGHDVENWLAAKELIRHRAIHHGQQPVSLPHAAQEISR